MSNTVKGLITQVRNQLDELNESSVDDTRDIIPSLNRGHDYACSMLARQYESPLLTFKIITTDGGINYPIPEDAFEQRVEHIELEYDTGYYKHLTPVDFRESTYLEGYSAGNYPTHWATYGNNVRILPSPGVGTKLRLWYSKDPGQLVEEQGRIRITPADVQDYLVLDEVGTDLSEDTTNYNSFFNVVDGQTGAIKGTFQIAYIEASRIYIRTSGTPDLVDAREVSTTFEELGIVAGDYVTSYLGTCIPILKKPLTNFLVQFAVSEITRKLGGDAPTEEAVLRKFEEQVKKTWAGRNKQLKVQRTNANWASPSRRGRRY